MKPLNQSYLKYILISFLFFSESSASTMDNTQLLSCLDQPEMQALRSKELQKLASADQSERINFETKSEEEKKQLVENDLIRRKRVGEILGEGCFKTADDYAAAAIIYQHGDVPDHYYQTFIWANRAVQLGNSHLNSLVAMSIDRYLISIGHMQLFGSQAIAYELTGWCYCLEPVESSFPESVRLEYIGASLQDVQDQIDSLNQGKGCSNIDCSNSTLKPSPKGTVPGFW